MNKLKKKKNNARKKRKSQIKQIVYFDIESDPHNIILSVTERVTK